MLVRNQLFEFSAKITLMIRKAQKLQTTYDYRLKTYCEHVNLVQMVNN